MTVSIACTADDRNTTNSLAVNQQIFKTTWQVFPRHLVILWSPLSNPKRPWYYGNRQLDWHKLWQEHWFQVNEECCHKISKHRIYDIVWQNRHVHLLVKLVASHMLLVYCNSLTEIHSRFKHYVYLVMHALITVRVEDGSSVVWIWQIFLWWRRYLDDNRKRVHDAGVVDMVIPFLQEHQHPELTKVACGFCLNSSVDYGMWRKRMMDIRLTQSFRANTESHWQQWWYRISFQLVEACSTRSWWACHSFISSTCLG